jgi:hypothetical protein
MINTIQTGVWKGNSGSIRIFGTKYVRSSNYQHDRKRRGKGEDKTTNGNGRGQDPGKISPESIERKGQILA